MPIIKGSDCPIKYANWLVISGSSCPMKGSGCLQDLRFHDPQLYNQRIKLSVVPMVPLSCQLIANGSLTMVND